MSRYREPQPKSSPYITAEGQARLRAEYDHLWRERRPEVVRALSAAAAEGDRSENAEYIYRKKELREIDRRVHYLQVRLPELKVAGGRPSDPARVHFGAWLELADEAGEVKRLRIVGADEIDPSLGCVSIDSPLARAVLGKREGDEVRVLLPGGERGFEIVSVDYRDAPPG